VLGGDKKPSGKHDSDCKTFRRAGKGLTYFLPLVFFFFLQWAPRGLSKTGTVQEVSGAGLGMGEALSPSSRAMSGRTPLTPQGPPSHRQLRPQAQLQKQLCKHLPHLLSTSYTSERLDTRGKCSSCSYGERDIWACAYHLLHGLPSSH
jgi:hypothetical protein